MIKRGLKKKVLTFLFITVIMCFLSASLFISFAEAQYKTETANAVSWLKERTSDKDWPKKLDIHQFVFSFLALKEDILNSQAALTNLTKKGTGECWPAPESRCKAKDTALAKLMLNAGGELTVKTDEWLLNQAIPYKNIDWFLQLTSDSNNEIKCLLKYENKEITINKEGKISGNPGTCFEFFPATEKYWLKLNKTCTDKTFNITCNNSFFANFLFVKNDNWFVTEQNIRSRLEGANYKLTISPPITSCIGQSECDYEATLWTAYAFKTAGKDVKKFKPYLISEKDKTENKKFLPEAFLYALSPSPGWLSELETMQRANKLWLAQNSAYNELYDTALVGVMTKGKAGNWSAARKILFKKQSKNGNWIASTAPKTIRDTAILLYALETIPEELSECALEGYRCIKSGKCDADKIQNYDCPGKNYDCCDIEYDNECEAKYGSCKSVCADNEAEVNYYCPGTGRKCCKEHSRLMCAEELKGKKCSTGQKCTENGFVIPFITTGDSEYCCLGECITPTKNCSELGGVICNTSVGFSCDNKWLPAIDTGICCKADACIKELKICSNMNGEICEDIQICKDGTFITAKDTGSQALCCVSGGRCIFEICPGEGCAEDENCDGTLVEALDKPRCCLDGSCLKSCYSVGQPCEAPKICKKPINGTDNPTCCEINECVEKKGFPIWLFLILIIIALGLVLFYLMNKKKKKPKQPRPAMMRPGILPPARPLKRRRIFPMAKTKARRPSIIPTRPAKPKPTRPVMPVPAIPMPKTKQSKPPVLMPKIKQAFPVRPFAKITAKPKPATKATAKTKPKLKEKRKSVLEELEKLSEE